MSARHYSQPTNLENIKLNALEYLIATVKASKELSAYCHKLNSDRFTRIIERMPDIYQNDQEPQHLAYIRRYEELKLMVTIAREMRDIEREFPPLITGQFTKPARHDF